MAFKSDLIRWMYIEYLVHSWLGLIGREGGANRSGKKRAWHNLHVGHTHLYIRPGRVLRGQRRARGKKNMRVYKRHGGRFFRASFSLITQRYHPRAWLISLYVSCHAPKIIREYFAGCSEDICWFFLCFWQKAESALSDRKKNSVKHQQFKDLVICFSVNFWWTCWLDFCHNYFCHKLYDFFDGVLVVWIFLFFFCTTTTWNPSFFI